MLRDSWLAKTQQAVLRSGGRRPPMPRHSRPMPRHNAQESSDRAACAEALDWRQGLIRILPTNSEE